MTTKATKNTIVNDGTMMTQTTRKNVTVFYSDSSQSIKSHATAFRGIASATAEGITYSVASPPQPQSNYVGSSNQQPRGGKVSKCHPDLLALF
jgi:hypothetical protein